MIMGVYIHQQPDWPAFRWDRSALTEFLADVRHRQGWLVGRMEALGFPLKSEAMLATLTEDVLKTSEIEGELLDRKDVRSSLARRLGIEVGALGRSEEAVEGVVEMMLDATRNFDRPLTKERLFDWHAALFPTGRSGMRRIRVGGWRDDATGPMQVVSGAYGRERVHFEAPSADRLDHEMATFLDWFAGEDDLDLVVKAGLAHLWFVTIHPFDDGNGRIARAIADMALARSERSPSRFYSMSAQIRIERGAYYDMLERTQKGDLDVTEWLRWFLERLGRAIDAAASTLAAVLRKAAFWEQPAAAGVNERQRALLNRLLDGFTGKLTSSKWAKIAKCSQDTALRDINDLVSRGLLEKEAGGGRSTSYRLSPLTPAGSGTPASRTKPRPVRS